MITLTETEDIAAIGRYVRRAELAARADERMARKCALQGRTVMAHLYRVSAQNHLKTAREMKALWGSHRDFQTGYCV